MRLSISIKVQKILMFIPFINVFGLFIWLYNFISNSKKPTVFAKSLLIIFASTIPLVIIQIILTKLFSNSAVFVSVLGYIFTYLIPLSMDFFLIKYQRSLSEKIN